MRKLMGEKSSPFSCVWCVLAFSKNNITSQCICTRTKRPRRFGCPSVGVNPHTAEVITETGLEEATRLCWDRLAISSIDGSNLGTDTVIDRYRCERLSLYVVLIFALHAFTANLCI
jgi:hypothetical protein